MVNRSIFSFLVLGLVFVAPPASAQDQTGLRRLARNAGLIFTGTVERIEPVAPAFRGDIGLVRVTFRVGDALRGTTPGEALTISEWDGLWNSGDRYRVGESLLLFLYPPSGDLGLTTTVGGEQGRISLGALSLADVARQLAESAPAVPEKPRPIRPPKPQLRRLAVE